MKIYGVYNKDNQMSKDEWFVKTIRDDCELCLEKVAFLGGKEVGFGEKHFHRILQARVQYYCEGIKANMGDVAVFTDTDIQFSAKLYRRSLRPWKITILLSRASAGRLQGKLILDLPLSGAAKRP